MKKSIKTIKRPNICEIHVHQITVRHISVLHFQPLRFCPSFSYPAFPVLHFQRPRVMMMMMMMTMLYEGQRSADDLLAAWQERLQQTASHVRQVMLPF